MNIFFFNLNKLFCCESKNTPLNYNFFDINCVYDLYSNINYIDKSWIFFSNIISIILISFYIILLGIIFPNKAKIIKFLNLISAFYLLIFFFLSINDYIYNITNINIIFEQNYNLYVNMFFFISTITIFLFFLSISDIFYLEENMKIEYTLLVFYVYIGALLLLSSLDFISIIILLECIAFSSYVLVGFERKNKFSTSSALKYLILAAVPSGFFILGISILYNNYGSFYQDYIEIFLASFDKFNLSFIDWIYTIEYYFNHNNIYFNNNSNINQYKNNLDILFINQFYTHLDNLNIFLKLNNPLLLLYLMDVELLLLTFPHLWLDNLESDDNFFLIENASLLKLNFENFYIDYYSRYLFIIKELFEIRTFWKKFYFLFTDINLIEKKDIISTFYIYLKNSNIISNSILDWITFFSYYMTTTAFATASFTGKSILYFFSLGGIKRGTNAYLEQMVFDPIFLNVDQTFFWTYAFSINHSASIFLNSFKHYIEYFLMSDFNINYILSLYLNIWNKFYFILYNFIDTYYENFEAKIYFNLEKYTYDHLISSCIYNNIFLSTYLIIIFILINLSFKITAAPFHFWAPSVYGGSPLPTITFLSVFSKLTIIFLFVNLFLTVFDNLKFIWQPILFFLGVFSIIISILGAFSEKLFKRFFVYSSIGHVGFMILGIAVLNYDGIQGTIDYLILYIISSFIVWFIVMHLTKKTTHLISFKGLSYNYPTLSLILIITLFSISGLPPMGGFFVKFEIFYSLINSSQYFIGYFLFILTVFSFFYYLRLIKIIYFEDNKFIKINKNLNDIKLRLISMLIFILPLYIILIQEPIIYILKEIIISSIR